MVGFKFVNKTLNDEYKNYFFINSKNNVRNYYSDDSTIINIFDHDASEPCTLDHFKGVESQ